MMSAETDGKVLKFRRVPAAEPSEGLLKQPRDQHWADLLEALETEADKIGGNGEITVEVKFHDGQPRMVRVTQSVVVYRLGEKGGTK
jgi:hypothetical protein